MSMVKDLLKPYIYEDLLTVAKCPIDFSLFKNKTVLITGAGDLLGYYLVSAFLINNDLLKLNTRVIAVDCKDYLLDRYTELSSRNDVEFLVSESYDNLGAYNANFVIHKEFVDNGNNVATSNLLEYISNSRVEKTVFCSDASVYGTVYNGKAHICENELGYIDPVKDTHLQSMRMAECIAHKFAQANMAKITFARLGKIYGAPLDKNDILYSVLEGNAPIKSDSNISNTAKSYCYVSDCGKGILYALTKGENEKVYNIASDNSVASERDFINSFSEVTTGKLICKKGYFSPINPSHFILNTDAIKSLGFSPKVSLENGIKLTAAIMKSSM